MTATDTRQSSTTGLSNVAVGFFRVKLSSMDTTTAYGYPDVRHGGAVNVLWLDGHVDAATCPAIPYGCYPFNSPAYYKYTAQ